MTKEHLAAIIEASGASTDGEWQKLPRNKTLTLHLAHDGVGLNVSRVRAVRVQSEGLFARTAREEEVFLSLTDLFACSLDCSADQARRPGFQ